MKTLIITCVFASLSLFNFSLSQEGRKHKTSKDTVYVTPKNIDVDISVLTPPAGFEESPSYNGYIDYKNSAGIIISVITDVNFLKLDEGMNKKFYSKNKLMLVKKNRILTNEGVKGIQYILSFELEGVEFVREIVYLGDLKNTLWLNVTYPKSVQELMADEILKSIKSVKFKEINYEK